MKLFKLLFVITVIAAISYFSWSYHTSKSLRDRYERSTLVLEELSHRQQTNVQERVLCYEQKIQTVEEYSQL